MFNCIHCAFWYVLCFIVHDFPNILWWNTSRRLIIRRKGRHRNSWMQEITTGMREKGIDNMEWVDREKWRRKIKVYAQEDVQTSLLST